MIIANNKGVNMADLNPEKITELEIKFSYQEKMLDDLNKVVYKQQQEIDALKKDYQKLSEQIKSMAESVVSHKSSEEPPPPHY